MNGNIHVQFLGEGVAATSPPYPTSGGQPPGRPGPITCTAYQLSPCIPPISLDLSRPVGSNQHHGGANTEEQHAVEAESGSLVES